MKKLWPYIQIMRVDHWFKNVFCLPGVVLAYVFTPHPPVLQDVPRIALGLLAVCLVASSNYVLNEILDAATDREHPDKHQRPIPSGKVSIPLAYAEYGLLTLLSLALSATINWPFFFAALSLWVMGAIYNVPPFRTKEVCYLDALTEAVNNPIRLALGWWMVDATAWPPLSILVAYWMLGAFLMALKRAAEYRHIGEHERACRYRKSFRHTDDLRLLISAVIYSNVFYFMLGVFIAKFRVELVLSVPFLALFGAYYLRISFRRNSLVQYPEKLYREKKLMRIVVLTSIVCLLLLLIDLPFLSRWFMMREPGHPLPIGAQTPTSTSGPDMSGEDSERAHPAKGRSAAGPQDVNPQPE